MTDAINTQATENNPALAAILSGVADAKVTPPTLQSLAVAGDSEALKDRLQTQANASRIKAAAIERIKKAEKAIADDEELVQQIANIFNDLPEGGSTGAAAAIKVTVGDIVEFKRVSRKEGQPDTVGTGVVKGIKTTAPVQYRVETGEGFDTEVFNLFPGQVTRNVTAEAATQAATQGELDV